MGLLFLDMTRIFYLALPFLIIGFSIAEVKSIDKLYSSKEDCLQQLAFGQDKEMIASLCDSLNYHPTKKEQVEILKRQNQIDNEQQEMFDAAVERRKKEFEKTPAFQMEQQEKEILYKCQFQKRNLQNLNRYYIDAKGKKQEYSDWSINLQLPKECQRFSEFR